MATGRAVRRGQCTGRVRWGVPARVRERQGSERPCLALLCKTHGSVHAAGIVWDDGASIKRKPGSLVHDMSEVMVSTCNLEGCAHTG